MKFMDLKNGELFCCANLREEKLFRHSGQTKINTVYRKLDCANFIVVSDSYERISIQDARFEVFPVWQNVDKYEIDTCSAFLEAPIIKNKILKKHNIILPAVNVKFSDLKIGDYFTLKSEIMASQLHNSDIFVGNRFLKVGKDMVFGFYNNLTPSGEKGEMCSMKYLENIGVIPRGN